MLDMPNSRRSEWSIFLSSVADYVGENMLQVQDAQWRKAAKTVRTYCNKLLERLLEGIDKDRAEGILRQSQCKRVVVQTTAARAQDPVNTRVLTFEEINALMNFDVVDCMTCEWKEAERAKCPKLKLLRRLDLDIRPAICRDGETR